MPEVVPVPVIYPRKEAVPQGTEISIRLNNVKNPKAYTVYFTINGDAPDPKKARKKGSSTLKYTQAFTLSPGRHTVRAVSSPQTLGAALSAIATKYFEIVPDVSAKSKAKQSWEDHDVGGHPLRGRAPVADVRLDLADVAAVLATKDYQESVEGNENLQSEGEGIDSDDDDDAGFYERRRQQHVVDYGVCDLCRRPWPSDPKVLFCQLCGYKRPEAIQTVSRAQQFARSLSPVSPIHGTPVVGAPQHPQTAPLPQSHQRPAHTPTIRTVINPAHVTTGPSGARGAPNKSFLRTSMITCPFCDAQVSTDTRFCISCQNSLPPSNSTGMSAVPTKQSEIMTDAGQGLVVDKAPSTPMLFCDACNKYSPATSSTCITCDAPLKATFDAVEQVQQIRDTKATIMNQVIVCKNCSKTNPRGSRFCNWCGFKAPVPVQQVRECEECGLENPLTSKFCSGCGVGLPSDLDDRYTAGGGDHSIMQFYTETSDGGVVHVDDIPVGERPQTTERRNRRAKSGPTHADLTDEEKEILAKAKRAKRKMKSVASQTGLYFPSAKKMEAAHKAATQGSRKGSDFDRFKHFPAVSIGPPPENTSGSAGTKTLTTWRRQIDHVFLQLKDYARKKNDVDAAKFQAEAMEFVMGPVTCASIRQDGDEICLTVSLVDMAVNPKARRKKTRSVPVEVQTEPVEGASLPPLSEILSKPVRREAARKSGMSLVTKSLLVELGAEGEGRSDTLLGLLDEGADVNVLAAGNQRPLHLAATNGRVEAVKFLIDADAQIDGRGFRGDTPLHAAVRAGTAQAKECLSVLLDAGADPTIKNADRLTPAGLAEELGNKKLFAFLGSRVAAPALYNLSRSKMQL